MNLMRSFYRLPKISGKCLTRKCSQITTAAKSNSLIIEHLTEREVIRVKGNEVVPFLQGLITNDIKHLHPSSNKAIYAMFLNKTGRVMYETIIYSTSEPTKFLIECDKNIADELKRHLKLYRVRRSIDIDSVADEFKVWQAFVSEHGESLLNVVNEEAAATVLTFTSDPRLKHLGLRLLASCGKTFIDVSKLFKVRATSATNEEKFRQLRYKLGIAEGIVDIPPGRCFPLEANCDILNGVSFHKGCYIGQELTARVYHTGMIRKRHMPVKLTKSLPTNASLTVLNEAGVNCGTIFGSTTDKALGLLRVENVLKAKELLVDGSICSTERPQWWPQEIHTNVQIRKNI